MARVVIGTSGWAYKHWRGVFYPRGLRQRDNDGFAHAPQDAARLAHRLAHLR